jgi:putative addiction module component (TIGR02574 family)
MAALTKAEIAALSTEERLALIDDIWESFEAPLVNGAASADGVPEWQKKILDRRLLDLETLPNDDVSLSEARNESLL